MTMMTMTKRVISSSRSTRRGSSTARFAPSIMTTLPTAFFQRDAFEIREEGKTQAQDHHDQWEYGQQEARGGAGLRAGDLP